ncbi:hypothetical protein EC991_007985 [Linnemannia zychae]|nr:hypothetical protein EC991_007985 [Linnemannia zychae]
MRSFIKAITLVAATIAVFAVWAPSPAQAQINSIFFDKRTAHNNAFKASGFNPLKELAEGPYPNANAIADSVEKRAVVGSCEPGWHVCTAAGGYCCSNDTLCSPVSRLCCSSQASYICGGSNCCPFNRCYADGSCGCDIGKTKCGTNCCTFGCDNTGNFCKCPDENPVDCGMYCCSIGYSCGAGNTCSAGTTLVIPSGPRTSSILVPRTSSRYGETGAGSISMSNLYLPGTEPTGVPLSTLPTPPPPSTNNAGAIGGGVAGGVVVIGIIGFIFIRRRKQQNLQATPTDVDMPNSIGGINGGKIEVESAPGSSPPRTSTPYTRPEHKEGAEQQHYQQQYPASQEYQRAHSKLGIQVKTAVSPNDTACISNNQRSDSLRCHSISIHNIIIQGVTANLDYRLRITTTYKIELNFSLGRGHCIG